MTNPIPDSEKPRLRAKFTRLLRGLGTDPVSDSSWRISLGIRAWLETEPRFRLLGTFAALPREPDLSHLHQLAPAHVLIYPLVHGDRRLTFHRVSDPATLEPGCLGIMEPNPRVHPAVPIRDIDAFLCPGLAFDPAGTRLGRGGGFYDRALARVRPDSACIGVCFSVQIAAALPREPHDMPMTHLADESGVRDLRPRPEGAS